MRRYEHVEAPGPPMAILAETCDDDGCDRRYVLPQGDLATVVNGRMELPPMPRSTDMDAYLEKDGWRHDYLMGKWSCGGTVRALFADSEAWDADREEALKTQELRFEDLGIDDPGVTRPDGVDLVKVAAVTDTTDQDKEATS